VNAQLQNSLPENSPAETRPIELQTDNGFSISRLWEVNRVPPPSDGNYSFKVRNPQSLERVVAVEIADDVVVQVELRTSLRILRSSSFWICCAERHLAIYLWRKDDYPPDDRLWVKQLDPEDLMTAIRWRTP